MERLVGDAIATIYIPREEDFGISAVESMAAGKPVIGVAEGGLLETVTHQQTGILLLPPPSVDALIDAVREMTPERALQMRAACEQSAKAFHSDIFLAKMKNLLAV